MNNFNWESINDFGHYGIFIDDCMFYSDVKEALIAALESGEDFDTGWHGFKKELQSMRISAEGKEITVCVDAFCDDPDALVWDCEESEGITDEQYRDILNYFYLADRRTEYSGWEHISRDSSLTDVMKVATEIADELNELLKDSYNAMKAIVVAVKEGEV